MPKRTVPASRLNRVAPAYPWAMPPAWGARVRLNSGSPEMLVVDVQPRTFEVTVGWPDLRGVPVEGDIDYRSLRPA